MAYGTSKMAYGTSNLTPSEQAMSLSSSAPRIPPDAEILSILRSTPNPLVEYDDESILDIFDIMDMCGIHVNESLQKSVEDEFEAWIDRMGEGY